MIKNTSDTSGTIVKPLYEYGMIVIDVWWDQDAPNDKNRQKGSIQCDLGQS